MATEVIEAPEWRSEVPVPKGSCSYTVASKDDVRFQPKQDVYVAGEVRVVDPETGGAKGTKPERYDLLPFEALDEVARVYGFGARKYDDHNWRKGYKWSLSTAAALRHISEFMQGNDTDDESGLHHLAHAVFHCLAVITYGMHDLGTDDRP